MKICLITDTHWGIRGDSAKFLDYFKKYYTDFFFPYLLQHDINTIIHCGDLMDRRKYVNINTAKCLQRDFLNVISERNYSYHQILGNHDCFHKNTNATNSFSVISKNGNIFLYEKAAEVEFDRCKILFVPWICDDNYTETFDLIKKTNAVYCFGHFEFNGFQMYRGMPSHGGMDKSAFNKFDLVCSGHYHHRSRTDNIQYLGAAMEYTWSDYEDPRGFAVFDTNTGELEFINSPINIFEKTLYDDVNTSMSEILSIDFGRFKDKIVKVIVRNKGNPYLFDQYMEKIEEQGVIELQVVDDHLNLDIQDSDSIIDEAESTMDIFNKFIDQTETGGIDRQKIKSIMIDLYNEANELG